MVPPTVSDRSSAGFGEARRPPPAEQAEDDVQRAAGVRLGAGQVGDLEDVAGEQPGGEVVAGRPDLLGRRLARRSAQFGGGPAVGERGHRPFAGEGATLAMLDGALLGLADDPDDDPDDTEAALTA